MAVWQFKIALVPQQWLDAGGNIKALFGDDGYDPEPAWKGRTVPDVDHELASLLPVGKSWSEALTLWGKTEADDIQLWRENGEVTDLAVRFDLRSPNMSLFEGIVRVARKLDLAMLDLSGRRSISREREALLRAAGESDAAHFVLDPTSFLEQLSPGGTPAT